MALRFRNLDGSAPVPFTDILRWAVVDRIRGRRRTSPAHADVPHVVPDLRVLATPPAAGEGARLTWLGHASWLVQLDGVTLLTIIRRDPRLRAIPTVMLTGVADEAEMRRATDFGASAYIVKPADAAELVRVIAASAAHWLRSYGKQAA